MRMETTMTDWHKSDWRRLPRVQMPDYPDADRLSAVEARLASYPPLVFAGEARRLKQLLGAVGRGEAFLLSSRGQAGRRRTTARA
jgi:3-deoxy-7-phosphoheptulonate synthase